MNARSTYLLKVTLTFILSIIITLILIIPAMAAIGKDENLRFADPYRVESFRLSGPGSLQVKTSGGHITVEGTSSDSVLVEMHVRRNGRDLNPDDTNLDDWDIDISQSGQTIYAIAKRERNLKNFFGINNQLSISFIVYTPRAMSSDLVTSGGHITVSSLIGEQQMTTSGGHISLSDLEGDIEARTSGGHIDVSDLEGDLNLHTSGGHINLNSVSSNIIEAKTSGGNITADFISLGSSADLSTSGGNINITVPRDTGIDLDLKGSSVNSNDLVNFTGKTERGKIEGKINGGGSFVSARTSGGVVSLGFNK